MIGLIQPDSGQFGLVHWQSKAAAVYLRGLKSGSSAVLKFRNEKAKLGIDLGGGIQYKESTRHYLEVEHWSYRKSLRRLVDSLSSGRPSKSDVPYEAVSAAIPHSGA